MTIRMARFLGLVGPGLIIAVKLRRGQCHRYNE
jgi:hypothetical protein